MSFSTNVLSGNKDINLSSPNKVTALNPNAAEFVPTALRPLSGSTKRADPSRIDVVRAPVKAVLDGLDSTVSHDRDDEAHLSWHCKLPDDITPDFNFMGDNESTAASQLSVAGLSMSDAMEASRFSASASRQQLGMMPDVSSHGSDSLSLAAQLRFSSSNHADDRSLAALEALAMRNWDRRLMNGYQNLTSGRQRCHQNGNSSSGLPSNVVNSQAVLDGSAPNPLAFLVSEFPGFAPEGLADMYHANGCDLDLTIENLTQIKYLADSNVTQNLKAKGMLSRSRSMADGQSGFAKYKREDFQQAHSVQRSLAGTNNSTVDLAEAFSKFGFHGFGQRKYDSVGFLGDRVGLSRRSNSLKTTSDVHSKSVYEDKLEVFGPVPMSPNQLHAREAGGNMYSGLKEGARDFARRRDMCFDQACLAHQNGNKELAQKLNAMGQLNDMQMKAAQRKAGESFHQERSSVPSRLQGPAIELNEPIDLRDCHGSEALLVLNHSLSILRTEARSMGRRLLVNVLLEADHNTEDERNISRLPPEIEQYLHDQKLVYTHAQPGLARVVVC